MFVVTVVSPHLKIFRDKSDKDKKDEKDLDPTDIQKDDFRVRSCCVVLCAGKKTCLLIKLNRAISIRVCLLDV